MTRLEVYCDRCGVLIMADRTRLAVECGPLRALLGDPDGPGIDLCSCCANAFVAWLRGPADAEEEEVHAGTAPLLK